MSRKAKALLNLWRLGKISEAALRATVVNGLITEAEYHAIVGTITGK